METFITSLLRILEFILALGLLIFLHELGHYIASKLFKIEVEEFGFGFPPRAVKLFQFRETEFKLNWIPFGAFVRPKGENDPEVPGGMAAAKPLVRFAVLLGGPLMNLLTGVLLFSILFAQTGAPNEKIVIIASTTPNSPAEQAGILAGDQVQAINGTPIQSMNELSTLVKANVGTPITITMLRNGETVDIQLTPRVNPPAGEGALGIYMSNPVEPVSFIEAIPWGVQITLSQGRQLFELPGKLITGQVNPEEARMVGPIGMYSIYDNAREEDLETTESQPGTSGLNVLTLLGIISVALGFTNLLPIPALDGGRILLLLPELIFRKRIPVQYENMINLAGFVLLILLMVFVTAQDILNPIQIP